MMNSIGPGNYGSETETYLSQNTQKPTLMLNILKFSFYHFSKCMFIMFPTLFDSHFIDVFLFFCSYASFLCFHCNNDSNQP